MCVQDVLEAVIVDYEHVAVLVIVLLKLLVVVLESQLGPCSLQDYPGAAGSVACYLMDFTLLMELIGKKKQFYESLL